MRLAAALLLVAAAGCVATRSTGSTTVARSYAEAVRNDDPAAAYDLLASSIKRKVSRDEWAARWKQARAERARQSQALGEALRAGATLGERARVRIDESQVATLVREDDGWRLETALLPAGGARTPEEALRRFADALDDRSFSTLMRLLTAERQEGLRQAVDGFAAGLRAHLGESIEVSNDRATLVWTDGSRRWRVVLKREQGGWRIDDFSQQ
jgi:hypothetical protein